MASTKTSSKYTCCRGRRMVRQPGPERMIGPLEVLKKKVPGLARRHGADLTRLWVSTFVATAPSIATAHNDSRKIITTTHALDCSDRAARDAESGLWRSKAVANADAEVIQRRGELLRTLWERGPVTNGSLNPGLLPRTDTRTVVVNTRELPPEMTYDSDHHPEPATVLSVEHGYFVVTRGPSPGITPSWLVTGEVSIDDAGHPAPDEDSDLADVKGFYYPHLSQAQMFAALYRQQHSGSVEVRRAAHVQLHIGMGANYVLVMPYEHEKDLRSVDMAANVRDLLSHMSVSSSYYRSHRNLHDWDVQERMSGKPGVRSLLDEIEELPPFQREP